MCRICPRWMKARGSKMAGFLTSEWMAEQIERAKSHAKSPEEVAAHDAQIRDVQVFASRQKREQREAELLASGVPLIDGIVKRFGRAKGDDPPPLEQWPARRAAQTFARGPRKLLALVGDTGTGKTTAAAAVAFSRLEVGPVVYVRERMLQRWQHFARYDRDWRRAVECATLIVDELGTTAERDRTIARDALLEVCDARSGGDRRTIVIGNLDVAAFEKYIDPRLLSRWHLVGTITPITGEDQRVALGKKGNP